jgi:flagellar hook-associated protein 1
MATINAAFNIIAGALEADQSGLDIVANNVANANTTGYTRQVPNWQENAPVQIRGISYGTGVTQTGPISLRDRVLETRLAQQQQAASASSARLSALESIQSLFTPASGSASSTAGDIGSDITGFFSSFSSLQGNPTDSALRDQVLSSARSLAGDISNRAASLGAQRASLDQQAAGITSQVNSLTQAIAALNQEIQGSSPDKDAGALEDQRQLDLSSLSQLIGINEITTENNGISITTTSGQLLVSEGSSYPLTTGTKDGVTHFYIGTEDITSSLASGLGQLGGLIMARDQDVPQVLAGLDQLAYSISASVNALNNGGSDLNGNTGSATSPLYIFNQPATVAGSAQSMSVVMTDPSQIAAASLGGGTGDNSNARAMAALAVEPVVSGVTPSGFYSGFVTALGATVQQVQSESAAQSASVAQLQTARNALSGVNLNDEAAFMQQFERSYQAASRVFAILNTIMTSAINLGVQTAAS